MTIQKLSSGSKKNCRFFCVCRDLAGFVGQKVLEDKKDMAGKSKSRVKKNSIVRINMDTWLRSIPGELYNGFTEAHISDLLVLLNITGVVKQNLLLFLKRHDISNPITNSVNGRYGKLKEGN